MGGDQIVIHVAWMARGIAQAPEAGHIGEPPQQYTERRRRAVVVVAVIGVHVLPDQRHLAHARGGQPFDLGDDLADRTRDFAAARIGHHAEGAELVATFLHGDEGGNPALGDRLARRRGEHVEFVLDREFGVDDLLAVLHARHEVGQPVIVLRADHQVDTAGAADDLLALGLCHAAGDRDQHAAALRRGGLLHDADAADLGVDLFRRFFADVAGIEDDEVGVLRRRGLAETGRHQGVRHTMRIVDVHLAAERLDVDFAGSAHAVAMRSGPPI